MSENKYSFKIIILGSSGVGKTNLLNRFIHNYFSLETKESIGVEYATRDIYINDILFQL